LQGLDCWSVGTEDHIRLQADKFGRKYSITINLTFRPSVVDPDVAAINPSQLLKTLIKFGSPGLHQLILFSAGHQRTDALHAARLLRPRRQRPCRCAADCRNEIPPTH
jgi:hypothetical protein